VEKLLINKVSNRADPHYEPFGWHHWPQFPWMSYQFRRALGETQEGGGAVSECFLAASRVSDATPCGAQVLPSRTFGPVEGKFECVTELSLRNPACCR
jgi:hypothetical protein